MINYVEPEDVAKDLMRSVNTMSMDSDAFIRVVMMEHRTLQQSAFRLFYGCIKRWAEAYAENRYDPRNEATCKACADIVELFNQRGLHLPFV